MNLLRVKNISESKGVSIRSVAEQIGMSEQNLHRCIRVNQIQAHQLEIIAKVLTTPVSYFFDDPTPLINSKVTQKGNNSVMIGSNNGAIAQLENSVNEVAHLKELLAEKEKQLTEKERLIQLLLNK